MLEFYDEAIEQILNPDDVLYVGVSLADEGNKRILRALKNDGSVIQLTKPMGVMTFPFEPLLYFSNAMGRNYMSNFLDVEACDSNNIMVNIDHFKNFVIDSGDKKAKFVEIFAQFDNDSKIRLIGLRKKFFEKHGRRKLEKVAGEISRYQQSKAVYEKAFDNLKLTNLVGYEDEGPTA